MPIRPPTKNAGAGAGGGGSAGAVGLGPPTNTFADTTARDTYATNNPRWLAQYNANRSFWISVGTGFQRRNANGNAWQDVTPVVQGADGEDGADGTQVTANPSGTDGDALNRIAIDGTNYNIEGGEGGEAATWDRRLNPMITSLGWKSVQRDGVNFNTATPRSFTTNASSSERYIGIALPEDLRYAIRNGQLGLSLRLFVRVRSSTSTTPSVLRFRLHDGETDFTALADSGNVSFAMNIGGSATGYTVLDLPASTNIGTSGNLYIRCTWISSPGGNTVTVDMHEITASTLGGGGGDATDIEPTDLDGIATATAGRLVAVGSDTSEFQQIDPDSLTAGIVSFAIGDIASGRNTLLDADRIPFAWVQGSGRPNRYITVENLKYELQLPYIAQFNVIGRNRVSAGTDIGGDTYRYSLQIGNPGHVGAARIVGFFRDSGEDPSPISPPSPAVLATIAGGTYAHASGEITIPSNQNLALAGDTYTIRLQVYEDGQSPATDRPFAYHDYPIISQGTSNVTHFGHVLSTEDVADIVFADDDISTAHGVAGNWVVSGLPNTGLHRLYWAVPATDTQPVDWHQGGTSIAPTVGAAVSRAIGGVTYNVYMFAAANAVSDSFNGQTIVVTT